MDIRDLEMKRSNLWEQAKNFLDTHTGSDGKISEKDAETSDKMMEELDTLTGKINRARLTGMCGEINALSSKPILTYPTATDNGATRTGRGVAGNEYMKNFLNEFRRGFKTAQNYLRAGDPVQGGYLVPVEFDDAIVSTLESENVMRQIGTVIRTNSEHRIVIVATKPQAAWVSEGGTIGFTDETFTQVALGAHKLAINIKVSNELLADSYYPLAQHLEEEFGKAIARAEEEAFITGTGVGQPTGILHTIATVQSRYIQTTASATISADDLINLQYNLPRPYRKNAAWLINDETLRHIRLLKDNTQNFVWQPSLTSEEPPRLLGAPVYTSSFMPTMASSQIAVLYGDFSTYKIGERGERTVQTLTELHALSGMTGFLMTERVDGILTDTSAVKGLYVK